MSRHFKLFYVCPKCESPLAPKDNLRRVVVEECYYCWRCGHPIASDIEEMVEEVLNEKRLACENSV